MPCAIFLIWAKPNSDARYAVFYSLADGAEGGRYYDVHRIENMRHALTILAYEMNGAPLRLRCENELGFKMVKWIAAIESCTTSPISARARAVIMRTTSSTVIACRSDRPRDDEFMTT